MNRYWRSIVIKGRVRVLVSRDGQEFQRLVAESVIRQGAQAALSGRIGLWIEARPPDRRMRDLDNLLKSTLDALTKAGVWLDDSQVDRIELVRGCVVKDGKLLVRITDLDADAAEQLQIAA